MDYSMDTAATPRRQHRAAFKEVIQNPHIDGSPGEVNQTKRGHKSKLKRHELLPGSQRPQRMSPRFNPPDILVQPLPGRSGSVPHLP